MHLHYKLLDIWIIIKLLYSIQLLDLLSNYISSSYWIYCPIIYHPIIGYIIQLYIILLLDILSNFISFSYWIYYPIIIYYPDIGCFIQLLYIIQQLDTFFRNCSTYGYQSTNFVNQNNNQWVISMLILTLRAYHEVNGTLELSTQRM